MLVDSDRCFLQLFFDLILEVLESKKLPYIDIPSLWTSICQSIEFYN